MIERIKNEKEERETISAKRHECAERDGMREIGRNNSDTHILWIPYNSEIKITNEGRKE